MCALSDSDLLCHVCFCLMHASVPQRGAARRVGGRRAGLGHRRQGPGGR